MAESMVGIKRSHRCTEVTTANIGQDVTVMGWVQKSRNKGGIIFVDLRDRSGILQIIFEESDCGAENFAKAEKLRSEFVIAVTGRVEARSGAVNPNLATGAIEVRAKSMRVLSESETPPFPIEENSKTKEDLRLKYRFLDLRRPDLQRNMMVRSRVATLTRAFLADEGFLEIETPTLIKSTPEGARDYLVPSRVHPGSFYALPQSPQLFKQLLMCSGYDRYFQIARCYRDEDLRGIKPAVVEMADRILPLQLDGDAAAEYQQRFEAHGCRFFLSAKAADTRRDGAGRITAVVLDDGTELECDFVIVAAGVRPEVRFLQNCGVQVDRSIQVDEYLRTTVPDVYAAGDVCGLSGIWPNAMKQGITAARNMCGLSEGYEDTYAMKNTMNFFGLPALCLGDINRVGPDTQVIVEEDSRVYRKALVENGRLKAILLLGDISASGIFQYLIKNEVPLPCCDRDIFRLTFADFYGFDKESGKYLWNAG